ncbi:sucrase ferredoxin domain containing protein [Colletotrichum truncatum]|uniref:Sucrase ferredoxin domain containing protein n=1 Tax=Colletotrichum truncatum TaxID=5467 RepID=A0ACC3ZCS1_COLTU|nr:sucrase ferredoxin domain containing protein [Colletotrichum truncatum]KAF6797874.1 sucrase ferredoxin domain containing protein [Colletotrichum truncatum]
MASAFKSLLSGAKKLALGDKPDPTSLFPKTDPQVDGDACEHDCESCHVKYPKGFKIDEDDELYGHIKAWSTHALVATGKSDWVRDVADEKGSVMEAIGKAAAPSNGKLMLSASNIPTPNHSSDYSEPTTVLLLPAFVIIDHVTPNRVKGLITEFVDKSPTNTSPLAPLALPTTVPEATNGATDTVASIPPPMSRRPCPHSALILLCSQKTRDARCGQSAPLLRKELERHLRPLGLFRDMDDERPGGVGIYFISHVGGHKYSANVMVYRRPDAFGLDNVERAKVDEADLKPKARTALPETEDVGAAQCIWLARIMPEDCENLVRYTILQGKVVKPEKQLRGGFDRAKGLMSW